jgi:hypothetical protein
MPRVWKKSTLQTFVIAVLSSMASLSGNTLQNTFFTNISSVIFDADTYYGIAQGLGFITTSKPATWNDVRDDFDTFSRRIYCYDYFSELDLPADAQPPSPKFRIPNPGWHPKTSGTEYSATYGVEEYVAQTRENVKNCIEDSQRLHATRPAYNLAKRHRDALRRLFDRRDIVFVDAE